MFVQEVWPAFSTHGKNALANVSMRMYHFVHVQMETGTSRFVDKVVVVTGASSGIGLATALQAAAEGARVVAVGRRQKHLEIAAEEIRAAGSPEVVAVSADVSTEDGNKAAIDAAIRAFGRVDALFANAGV
jgi:NADP-dependent 3-hydroxy acid dehydrogenase YdfG